MAYAVLVGTSPGVYLRQSDATAASDGCTYYVVKYCKSPPDAEQELVAFLYKAGRRLTPTDITVVYTDGACSNNGKSTAAAGVGVFWGDEDPRNVSRPVRGTNTNNVAELEAIEDALDGILLAQDGREYRIITDSQYAIHCLCTWYDGWKERGWITASGSAVKNVELICRIHDKLEAVRHSVRLVHVRGHVGVPGNEAADALAVDGRRHAL